MPAAHRRRYARTHTQCARAVCTARNGAPSSAENCVTIYLLHYKLMINWEQERRLCVTYFYLAFSQSPRTASRASPHSVFISMQRGVNETERGREKNYWKCQNVAVNILFIVRQRSVFGGRAIITQNKCILSLTQSAYCAYTRVNVGGCVCVCAYICLMKELDDFSVRLLPINFNIFKMKERKMKTARHNLHET